MADANFSAVDLEAGLKSGDLTVTTSGAAGVEAGDIDVTAKLAWIAGSTLNLSASHSIVIRELVSVVGSGGLTLTSNRGGGGGQLSFGKRGRVKMNSATGRLSINGSRFSLVHSIAQIASAIAAGKTAPLALVDNYDATPDGIYSSSPIASDVGGSLEGLGNSILNLSIDYKGEMTADVALFSRVGGTVSNLRLLGVSVTASNITQGYVGGIAGENYGTLFGDEVTGTVFAPQVDAGGMAGLNYGAVVSSVAHDNVNGGAAGGLVGHEDGRYGGYISMSSATGTVTAHGGTGGGLVGLVELGASVEQSFTTGLVTGPQGFSLGGLVGQLLGTSPSGNLSSINNSYAFGAVQTTTGHYLGGLIGTAYQTVSTSCYSIGSVGGAGKAGGFIGHNIFGMFSANYWDKTSSNVSRAAGDGGHRGMTALTTKQLKAGLPAGFDPAVWAENPTVNNGYPYLIANPPQ